MGKKMRSGKESYRVEGKKTERATRKIKPKFPNMEKDKIIIKEIKINYDYFN